LQNFNEAIKKVYEAGFSPQYIHAANSLAMLGDKESFFNLVRPGLAVYRYIDFLGLKPSLSFKTQIVAIKEIPTGSCISYGCLYKAPNQMKIALLPTGYADGILSRQQDKV